MNTVIINGQRIDVAGRNISVQTHNGVTTVNVDGNFAHSVNDREVKISFEGDLASLNCASCTVNGNIKGDVDCTSINCKDIVGNVDGTTVNCGNVSGSIDAITVNCKNNSGTIKF